jgi:predicted esterase
MISENFIQTSKTARYYLLGNPSNKIENIWFVFHGFGQLACDFINEFNCIANEKTLIIAPEAMNKFYIRGFTGKIGSTWMTKEDRENEIIDYINFANNVYKEILDKVDLSKINFNVFGFSQGGHTVLRWLNKSKVKVHNLIIWGSGFARDINYDEDLIYWNNCKSKLVIGRKDKFITKETLEKEIKFLQSIGINYELIEFDGDHAIDEYILKKIDNPI